MKPSPERIAWVESLKATLRVPMTDDEKATFRSTQAREMAAAERRRREARQMELEHA